MLGDYFLTRTLDICIDCLLVHFHFFNILLNALYGTIPQNWNYVSQSKLITLIVKEINMDIISAV